MSDNVANFKYAKQCNYINNDIHTYIYKLAHIHTHALIHTHTYIYIYTYICTHTVTHLTHYKQNNIRLNFDD